MLHIGQPAHLLSLEQLNAATAATAALNKSALI